MLPTSDPGVPLDTATDQLIPADAAKRYNRERIPDSLADALAELIQAPDEIARRREATRGLKGKLVRPWDDVIADDIADLKNTAVGRRAPQATPASTS